MKHTIQIIAATVVFVALTPLATLFSDTGTAEASTQKTQAVAYINSVDELKEVLEKAGDRLLLFDLYADWCMPCKILGPRLEKIASDNHQHASVYKINVDKNPQIAGMFGVRGIPYVVFVKEQTAVHAITGVRPIDEYQSAIRQFSKQK